MTDTDKTEETGPSAVTLDEAHEAGFLGTVADPEPNESYALGGKLAQQPPKDDDTSSSSSSSSAKSSGTTSKASTSKASSS
jgi:hypothetical protein